MRLSDRSVIGWPGGKWYQRHQILAHVPEGITEMVSPFLGGGHIEMALQARGVRVWGSDIYLPLMILWDQLVRFPVGFAGALAGHVGGYPLDAERAQRAVNLWRNLDHTDATQMEKAVAFYASIKLGYGGMPSRCSAYQQKGGGWKLNAAGDRKLRAFHAPNMRVGTDYGKVRCLDYREALAECRGMFAYVDPPYKLHVSKAIYGEQGEVHRAFDHEEFLALMGDRPGPWLLSYNDCPEVRDTFRHDRIVDVHASYRLGTIRTRQQSRELLVIRDA